MMVRLSVQLMTSLNIARRAADRLTYEHVLRLLCARPGDSGELLAGPHRPGRRFGPVVGH